MFAVTAATPTVSRCSIAAAQQQLLHLGIAMIGFHHLSQLPPDEEDRGRNAEDGLSRKQEQVLLGAGPVLALAHLEGEEGSPQHQQLDHLQNDTPHHNPLYTIVVIAAADIGRPQSEPHLSS